jgi:hypothetical protein
MPGDNISTPEQLESASRRHDSLYENGMRVRHDPIDQWKDP